MPEKQEEIIEEEIIDFGTLYIHSDSDLDTIKKRLASYPYSRVVHVPDKYLVKYKCNLCGHEWDNILPETNLSANKMVDCIMGCSRGADWKGFTGFYRSLIGLITGKEPFGYGVMIESSKI